MTTNDLTGGKQVVLILVGLVGSGKSTFAQALELHFPEFRRCNQDDLGDRRQVERLSNDSLRNGFSICIDRTNFDQTQRSHWVRIAREFPGTLIWVIVFDTPKEVCADRLRKRTGHPTIKNPQDALSILERFSSMYRAPSSEEGYDRILYLTPAEQELEYSQASLSAILQRVRDAPPVPPASVGYAMFEYPAHGSRYSGGGFHGGGGYNINCAGGFRGYRSTSAWTVNRWETFSGQGQATSSGEPQTSPDRNPPHSSEANHWRPPTDEEDP